MTIKQTFAAILCAFHPQQEDELYRKLGCKSEDDIVHFWDGINFYEYFDADGPMRKHIITLNNTGRIYLRRKIFDALKALVPIVISIIALFVSIAANNTRTTELVQHSPIVVVIQETPAPGIQAIP